MTVKSGQSEGTIEVTPSGIPVYYQSQPKRLYRIGPTLGKQLAPDSRWEADTGRWLPNDLLADAQENSKGRWREVPSVTTVLGVLDKSGLLIWWAQGVAAEGIQDLVRMDELRFAQDEQGIGALVYYEDEAQGYVKADKQAIIDLLVYHKLSTNHVRDKAGDRGQAVHDALENWARYGHRPDPSIYPEEQEGYVRGLLAFLDDVPSAEPEGAEVLVASVEYGYAGRYDLRLRTNEPHEVVVRRTKTKVRRRTLAPGRILADLKTSAGAYPSHALQLAAYEQASLESGYEPTDGRGVLIVTKDGFYEFKRTKATADDFHAVLEVYNRMQNKKEWL